MTLTRRSALSIFLALPLASRLHAQEAAAPTVSDFGIGPADARVTIIEYASFTCPHCASFHAEVFKPLKADYVDAGKVRFVYREFYRNRLDLWAAMIARCGGEMRYFGITDILFEKQSEWASSEDPAVIVDNLKRIGRSAGLEDAAMDACLNDQAMAEALVARFQETSTADNVTGTPTLIMNGVRVEDRSLDAVRAEIDRLLAG
jgi:protein-disulfide isomerase